MLCATYLALLPDEENESPVRGSSLGRHYPLVRAEGDRYVFLASHLSAAEEPQPLAGHDVPYTDGRVLPRSTHTQVLSAPSTPPSLLPCTVSNIMSVYTNY